MNEIELSLLSALLFHFVFYFIPFRLHTFDNSLFPNLNMLVQLCIISLFHYLITSGVRILVCEHKVDLKACFV